MVELRPARAADLFPALESKHCRAICHEIGDRLRHDLTGASPLPTRLRKLVNRIAELEGNSPPITPDCQDEPSPRERPKHELRFWFRSDGAIASYAGCQVLFFHSAAIRSFSAFSFSWWESERRLMRRPFFPPLPW